MVNVLSRFFRDSFRLLKKDFRIVYKRTNRALFRGKYLAIGFLGVVLLSAWLALHPYDREVLEQVQAHRAAATQGGQNNDLHDVAYRIGRWGDFAQFNLLGFAVLWIFGAVAKMRWFQRLAVVTFYSALIAGLTCNVFRFSLGRPRPYAVFGQNIEDKFHGLPGVFRGWAYHGFPSGHTSTSMGMATSFVTTTGVYGVPVLVFGASVGWARIYTLKHFPTDVLVGGSLGIIFGVASGWHLRRVRLRCRRQKKRLA